MRKASAGKSIKLCAVVVAAGGSSRLGRPKQLLRYRGHTLMVNAVDQARAALPVRTVVVLGAEHRRLAALLRRHDRNLVIVRNAAWRDGLASSLRAGIARVPRAARGVLIVLVDQPRVRAQDIERLAARWRARPGKPAAAEYDRRIGVPAIFPRAMLREITSLDGDIGARELLRARDDVTCVPVPAAALDIDTPADLSDFASRN